jgi:hypothetical protein
MPLISKEFQEIAAAPRDMKCNTPGKAEGEQKKTSAKRLRLFYPILNSAGLDQ